MEITLNQVEVNKLSLEPGDTLIVKIKSENVDEDALKQMKQGFEKAFEGHEVKLILFNMSLTDDLSFDVIKENKDNKVVSYCSDCSCGKKEKVNDPI